MLRNFVIKAGLVLRRTMNGAVLPVHEVDVKVRRQRIERCTRSRGLGDFSAGEVCALVSGSMWRREGSELDKSGARSTALVSSNDSFPAPGSCMNDYDVERHGNIYRIPTK